MPDKSINKEVNSIIQRPKIEPRPKIVQRNKAAIPASSGSSLDEETKNGTLGDDSEEASFPSTLTEVNRTETPVIVYDTFNVWQATVLVAENITMSDSEGNRVTFYYNT